MSRGQQRPGERREGGSKTSRLWIRNILKLDLKSPWNPGGSHSGINISSGSISMIQLAMGHTAEVQDPEGRVLDQCVGQLLRYVHGDLTLWEGRARESSKAGGRSWPGEGGGRADI